MTRLFLTACLLCALPFLSGCGGDGYAAGNNNGAMVGGSILKFPMEEQK